MTTATTESTGSGNEKTQLLERIARERAAADRERSGSRPPQQPAPRRSKRLQTSRLTPVLVILLYVATSAANALTFKRMTDVYADAEFFASQWNVLLYTAMALFVVASKAYREPTFLKTQRACFGWHQIVIMAMLDSVSSVCSTIGGANTAGAVQNLINQTLIPMTLVMSAGCLGSTYSPRQICGAAIILAGACWAVSSAGGKGDASTTWAGALVFTVGILPSAYSNVYKEGVFNLSVRARAADVFYLTTVISGLQVFLGFLMVPLLPLPAFGGTPLGDVLPQLGRGFACFAPTGVWARDSSPIREALFGDDDKYDAYADRLFAPRPPSHDLCDEGFVAMMAYVLVNFGYNILQLLICQHSSAATLVMATALALPATSLMFSSKRLVGRDAMPYGRSDLVGLLVVVVGFVVYSAANPDEDGVMPPQAAAGSTIYVRRPRADSDPPTPAVLRASDARGLSPGMPRRARATSFDTRHHVSSPGDLITLELKRGAPPKGDDANV